MEILFDGWQRETIQTLIAGVQYAYQCDVEGDVAEFGTMAGVTAQALAAATSHSNVFFAAKLARLRFPQKTLHLFDSFCGLPETDNDIDLNSPHVQSGVWQPGTCRGLSAQELHQRVAALLPEDRIVIHEGWFADTLPHLPENQLFSVLHIDSDLYASARDVLDATFERGMVAEGCMVLFDDWNCNRARRDLGERRAWTDAVEKYGIAYSDEGAYGFASRKFIIHGYATMHRNAEN